MFVDATSHQHVFYFDFAVDKKCHSGSVNVWHNDSGTILLLYHMQKRIWSITNRFRIRKYSDKKKQDTINALLLNLHCLQLFPP